MYEIKGRENGPPGVDSGCYYMIQKAENYC